MWPVNCDVFKRVIRGGVAPVVAIALSALTSVGCRQKMEDQPHIEPHEESDFFDDGLSARPRVPGTVARGHLKTDRHYFSGLVNGKPARELPSRITRSRNLPELLTRGRERFNIYCAACHDRTGSGRGMVVQRGFPRPPSYHSDRLRREPVGHFFDVATRGFGRMPSYADQVPVADRWAIAAYVRALQLSRNTPAALLRKDEIDQLR